MHSKRVIAVLLAAVVTPRAVSQCANTCSTYVVSPYTFSLYAGGAQTIALQDDEVSTTLPLGFVFDYYCVPYNQVRIASNGFITFDFGNIIGSNTPYAQALPNPSSPNAVIAWNWNDLDPSAATGAGTISYTTTGASPNQQFIVTYSAVPLWTNAPSPSTVLNTGQIILNESTNIIEIHIQQARNNGWLTHTEGIEDNNGANATPVTNPPRNLTLWQANNSSHIFSPFTVSASVNASGPTTLCPGETGVYSATATPAPLSYNWFLPNGWSGTSTSNTISAIAGASGNVSVSANYICGPGTLAAIPVTVTGAPSLTISPQSPTMLCSGYTATFSTAGAASYTLQPGGASGSGPLATTVFGPTVFTLTGTGPTGCLSQNNPTIFINTQASPTITVNSGTLCQGESFQIIGNGAFYYTYEGGSEFVSPSTPGVHHFTVTGTGINGCVSYPAITTVTVVASPPVQAVASRTAICKGEKVTLTASGALTYTWTNVIAAGPSATASPFMDANYVVKGTDANGCIGTSTVSVKVSTCTSVAETTEKLIQVFPVPFEDEFELVIPHDSHVEIADLSSRVLYAAELPAGTHRINFQQSKGVFVLSAVSDGISARILLVNR